MNLGYVKEVTVQGHPCFIEKAENFIALVTLKKELENVDVNDILKLSQLFRKFG